MEGGKTPSGQPAPENVFLSQIRPRLAKHSWTARSARSMATLTSRAGAGVCIRDHDSAKRSASPTALSAALAHRGNSSQIAGVASAPSIRPVGRGSRRRDPGDRPRSELARPRESMAAGSSLPSDNLPAIRRPRARCLASNCESPSAAAFDTQGRRGMPSKRIPSLRSTCG